MGDLSAHFSRSEFVDKRTGELIIDMHLIEHLEDLRALCGDRPLRIISGYRSVRTNDAVGGAFASQHLEGRAADIPEGYCRPGTAVRAGFTGIGISRGGSAVHVDVRPGPLKMWRY